MMLRLALCCVVMLLALSLGACSKEDVRQNISQGLKRSCEMNAKHCTTGNDDGAAMRSNP